jgi:Na+-driven multidrug efflux pump
MSVYTGQNVGAGRIERVEQGLKQGMGMAVGISASITLILLLFGHALFDLFTDTPELMDLAVRMMRILAFGYICVAVTQVLGGIMRGCGDTVTHMWITMVSTIVLRIPVAYGLAYLTRSADFPNGQPHALFISLLISWSLGALISYVVFLRGKWRRKAMEVIERKQ